MRRDIFVIFGLELPNADFSVEFTRPFFFAGASSRRCGCHQRGDGGCACAPAYAGPTVTQGQGGLDPAIQAQALSTSEFAALAVPAALPTAAEPTLPAAVALAVAENPGRATAPTVDAAASATGHAIVDAALAQLGVLRIALISYRTLWPSWVWFFAGIVAVMITARSACSNSVCRSLMGSGRRAIFLAGQVPRMLRYTSAKDLRCGGWVIYGDCFGDRLFWCPGICRATRVIKCGHEHFQVLLKAFISMSNKLSSGDCRFWAEISRLFP